MRVTRTVLLLAALGLLALTFTRLADRTRAAEPAKDPVAAEFEHWSAFLRDETRTGGFWEQVRQANLPVVAHAGEDLKAGRRLLALQRLASVRVNVSAMSYLSRLPARQRQGMAGFEAEWARLGKTMRDDLRAPSPAAFEGVRPAAVRALAEASLPQVREYYDASLDYGRNTSPGDGLFYLATAQAQRELTDFFRTFSEPSPRPAPPLRALDPELDALETEMLAAYRPPASIDRHGDFITTSATLKEARELNAAGLRYGALLRYLQAAQSFAALRPAAPKPGAGALAERLRGFGARLSAGNTDHSIGRLFLETAQAQLAGAAPGTAPASAMAIAGDVLPRYFAALEPARPRPPAPAIPAPGLTVTLIRWPYT
ncbi:MAG TPA: hypothetical protein VHC97_02750 [Thermoanaerobaculia bacterium]|nr:hypothetical protein [Thermoanaerobaculia bacterium]